VVVKKTFRYSNVFSYNHLYQPECFYEKRYNIMNSKFSYKYRNSNFGFVSDFGFRTSDLCVTRSRYI